MKAAVLCGRSDLRLEFAISASSFLTFGSGHLIRKYGSIPYMQPAIHVFHGTLAVVMPRTSKLPLSPLPPSAETPGQRLARIRRERGFTQVELAEKAGLVQTLVSDYERGKLRLNAERILRFAKAPASRAVKSCAVSSRLRRSRSPGKLRCYGPSIRFWKSPN